MNSRLGRGVLAALVFGASACGGHRPMAIPAFPDGGMLANATPLSTASLAQLSGRFQVTTGSSLFLAGDTVSVYPTRSTVSIFGFRADSYAILKAGCVSGGSSLILEGYWRFSRSFTAGLIRLEVGPASYASALCAGTAPPAGVNPTFTGNSGDDANGVNVPQGLQFTQSLANIFSRFNVIAHHGPCRTIDECGYSENSVEGVRALESFGANWIEIDARLTHDGVPIAFHDERYDDRLVNGQLCHGQVADLPYAYVQANCTLKYGESVPTVAQLLTAVVKDTRLDGVWMDVKSAEAVAPLIPVIQQAQTLAQSLGRTVSIVMDLPEDDVIAAYVAAGPTGISCMVENDVTQLTPTGCKYWGPRFTDGAQVDQVHAVQRSGGKVFSWTIDDTGFMDFFMTGSRVDGIDTDRPGVLFDRAQINATAILGGS